jgi:hypothetical protein
VAGTYGCVCWCGHIYQRPRNADRATNFLRKVFPPNRERGPPTAHGRLYGPEQHPNVALFGGISATYMVRVRPRR